MDFKVKLSFPEVRNNIIIVAGEGCNQDTGLDKHQAFVVAYLALAIACQPLAAAFQPLAAFLALAVAYLPLAAYLA